MLFSIRQLSILFFLIMIIFASFAYAHETGEEHIELPANIQKIIEANRNQAVGFMESVTFPIAFFAGILSILSPCILPLFPAFFAYSFKEKKNIGKMTFVFFLGFSLIFVIFGLLASALGQSLGALQQDYGTIIMIVGIFLIMFGLMSIFNKGFPSFIKISKRFGNNVPGVFLFGVTFAVGWSACLGPILAGILLIASALGNFLHAGLLLFIYSLGIFTPLFILSFFFDKSNLVQSRWIKGRIFKIRKYKIHSTNLISGALFIFIGFTFLIFRGTLFVNDIDILGTRMLFFDFQRFLFGSNLATVIGLIILAALLILILKTLKK